MKLVLALALLIPISCELSFRKPSRDVVSGVKTSFRDSFKEVFELIRNPFMTPNPCLVVARSEPCSKQYTNKWYFHSKKNECVKSNSKQFCMVGPNSFKSQEDCNNMCTKKTLTDICKLPKDQGKCEAGTAIQIQNNFYYNSKNKKCEKFRFCSTGTNSMEGNQNNFKTLKDCEKKCAPTSSSTKKVNECFQQVQKSSCSKSSAKFYFDLKINRCVAEKNGCVSGENAFENPKECVLKCPQIRYISKKGRLPMCSKLGKKTNCVEQINKTWSFDSSVGECVQYKVKSKRKDTFGCYIGENSFFLKRDCEKKCQVQETKIVKNKFCKTVPSQSSCTLNNAKVNEVRYYFNDKLKRCKPYTYCGDDSQNSFKDLAECRAQCHGDE